MQAILTQNETHKLTLEKTGGQWWLECIERASGKTRIAYFERKDKATAFCKGMSMPEVVRIFSEVMKIEPVKMYKEGI
jgi:hypothetical protein